MTNEDNRCSICLKSFDDPRWIPCKHIYCFKCIPRLHRRDLDTKDQIILQCRVCTKQHSFPDWSTVKYYATLHCVPYLTALQFDTTSVLPSKSSCAVCFRTIGDKLECCIHCDKMICRECLIDHRMELKKNILQNIDQYWSIRRKGQQCAQEMMKKIENLKIQIDLCADELIDQIDTYSHSILTQIDEQRFPEETNSSSGYESSTEQRLSDSDCDINLQSEPSIVPIHSRDQLTSSTSRILWTMNISFAPSHLAFEPNLSKLFICDYQGYISIYDYTAPCLLLTDSFFVQSTEKFPPAIIKSLAACENILAVILNSSIKSILHLYSHHGNLLHVLSFCNEYISQIRFDNHHLWCLELMSSSLFYFTVRSNQIIDEKTQFILFQLQSFNPFRFALNQTLVAVLDRATTGTVLLYDKQTASYLKQIQYPFIDIEPYDIELTNQLLIYRGPHEILLTQIDLDQFLERINTNKTLNITVGGKADTKFFVSSSTDDNHTFQIQFYVK